MKMVIEIRNRKQSQGLQIHCDLTKTIQITSPWYIDTTIDTTLMGHTFTSIHFYNFGGSEYLSVPYAPSLLFQYPQTRLSASYSFATFKFLIQLHRRQEHRKFTSENINLIQRGFNNRRERMSPQVVR